MFEYSMPDAQWWVHNIARVYNSTKYSSHSTSPYEMKSNDSLSKTLFNQMLSFWLNMENLLDDIPWVHNLLKSLQSDGKVEATSINWFFDHRDNVD